MKMNPNIPKQSNASAESRILETPLKQNIGGLSFSIDQRTHYGKGGKRKLSSTLYARFSFRGKQQWANLKTRDPELAVGRAIKKISDLRSGKSPEIDPAGATFSKARGQPPVDESEAAPTAATIGQFLAAYEALGTVSRGTESGYRNKVLRIAAWIEGIEVPVATTGPKRMAYEQEAGAVRLSAIQEQDLMAWRERQVELCRRDSKDRLSPRTANGSIAAWWAVFGKSSLWSQFGLTWFPGLDLRKLPTKKVRFRVLVPLQKLIDKANLELKELDPDCYDLFLLAVALGLRRKEAEMLLWSAFCFDREILDLKASTLYGYKTYDSEGEVKIYSDKVLGHFRSRYENRTSDFVLNSDRPTGEDKNYSYYRCEPTSDRLAAWLRSHGVVCAKPIQYLRGAGGNQVRIDNDIFAAKCFLRHSQIQTTIEFYSEVDTSYSTTLSF